MFAISIVTFNRKDMLRQVLEAIEKTCPESYTIYVTDNASSDGTPEMLREMEDEDRLKAFCLPENLGTSGGRNAQMAEWLGTDSVRLDDKMLIESKGWLTSLKVLSDMKHAILTIPYDPVVKPLEIISPIAPYVKWDHEAGQGGPLMYVPGEVSAMLGGADEMTEGDERCLYGWDDCAFIKRAKLMGWNYGFTLRIPYQILAQASPARREYAMRWHPQYMELCRQYEQAERDVFIPIEDTYGYKVGNR